MVRVRRGDLLQSWVDSSVRISQLPFGIFHVINWFPCMHPCVREIDNHGRNEAQTIAS
jgi:hypothetical protein